MIEGEKAPAGIKRTFIIVILMLAGEVVFLLPFVVPRIFRPTFLDVFGINNFELGTAFSVYGIVAIFCYFLGGPLADRFPARYLMSVALVATAAGGFVLAAIPSLEMVIILYGFWGMTTILLFWAALIRSARIWGGKDQQGKAYGLLDGGRGLAAAVLASISVAVFSQVLPVNASSASLSERAEGLSMVILVFSAVTLATAVLIWIVIPGRKAKAQQDRPAGRRFQGLLAAIRMPAIWLQAVIIVCAYVGYKATDDFSLYARDAFGFDDVAAANVGAVTFWTRPFAAVAAGLFADRLKASLVVIIGFAIMAVGCFAISAGLLRPGVAWVLFFTVVFTSVGIYALRGVYFALMEEAKVPVAITGTAVGIVSVIGFLPDVFMGPWMGYLIDRSPGATGHEHVFLLVGCFAVMGVVAAVAFAYLTKRNSTPKSAG